MKVTKVLLIADSFNIFASGMFGPIYAVYVQEINGGLVTIGSSVAILSFFSALCLFLISRIEDKIKNWKMLMIISYLLFAVAYFLYIFVRNVPMLFMIQALVGIAYSIGTPVYKGLYSKSADVDQEAKEWGNLEVMNQLIMAVSALAGSLLVAFVGFEYLFILMSSLALVSAFTIYTSLE